MFILQHSKIHFTCFASRHIVLNVTLVLKAKALEDVVSLGHLALALKALVLALEFAA